MGNQMQRLDKIERAADPDQGVRILFVNPGEKPDDVRAKAGPYSGRTVLIRWEESDRDL